MTAPAQTAEDNCAHWNVESSPRAALVDSGPLLARCIHNQAALDFLKWVQRGSVQVGQPADASLGLVLAICERFASLPLDLADASIAEAAQRLNIRHVLSVDKAFDIYRDAKSEALVNLLR